MDQQEKEKEPTEVERRLAERAEAEFEQEAQALVEEQQECMKGGPHEPHPGCARGYEPPLHFLDDRWEPPQRPLYDMEVVALVNRDCGRYAATGLMLDSVEDVDAFTDRQLEHYRQFMTVPQAEYYKLTVAELLFKAVLASAIQARRRQDSDYRAAANQIAQEANRPDKRRRGN